MSYQAVKEYLHAIHSRYQAGSKSEKSKLLAEAQLVCKLSRRQLRRQLTGDLEKLRGKKNGGRPRKYSREIYLPHVQHLWMMIEQVSAKRLKAAMLEDWLGYYLCEPHIKAMLAQMSVSTLARFLKDIRGSMEVKKGISTTCPARYMKNKIPLATLDRKID